MVAIATMLPEPPLRLLRGRHVAAAVAGNAMEFYDFTAYAFFAVEIGRTFFPGHSTLDSLILSLMTFGVGFIGRPLGAVVLGAYGDRMGRRPAMTLSFCLMCVGSLGLAVTPSYASIGPAAPMLVLAARLVQGFALGGEVGPATAFLIEAAPVMRRGYFGAWQYASQSLAHIAAGLFGLSLVGGMSGAWLERGGWRVPFLIGAAVLPLGWYLRHGLPETLAPAERLQRPAGAGKAGFRRVMILGLPMLASTTIGFGMLTYMNTYATAVLHLPRMDAFGATIAWGIAGTVFALAGGWASDRVGRKVVMIAPRVVLLLLIMPGYWWIVSARSGAVLVGVTFGLSALTAFSTAPSLVCLTEAIPKPVRCASLAIVYAVAIAAFNGTAQLLVTWLIKASGDVLWPGYYFAAATLAGLAPMALMPETAPAATRTGAGWATR